MKDFSEFIKYCNDKDIFSSIENSEISSTDTKNADLEIVTKTCINSFLLILKAYHEWLQRPNS